MFEPDRRPRFNPHYRFDSFVAGPGSLAALVAAQHIASGAPHASLTVFWGDSGLGKTHLLHAIGNAILERNPAAEIQRIRPVREPTFPRKGGRAPDIVLIESAHFFAIPYCDTPGLDRRQRATLRKLHDCVARLAQEGTRLVMESDRPPKRLRYLGLPVSRLAMGIEVKEPDFATRVAILRSKAKRYQRELSDDVVRMIAEPIENPRALEGGLNRLLRIEGRITLRRARTALRDMLEVYEGVAHKGIASRECGTNA